MTDAHCHAGNTPPEERICFFVNACTPDEWPAVNKLAWGRGIVPFFGVHPWFAEHWSGSGQLEALLASHPEACVGEIGLDRIKAATQAGGIGLQIKVFEKQLALAVEYNRPVTIHCVRAWDLLFFILGNIKRNPIKNIHALVHFFSGSREIMEQLLDYGFYISFAPKMHHPGCKKMREAFLCCPDERLLLESDSTLCAGSPDLLQDHYRKAALLRGVEFCVLERLVDKNGAFFTNRAVDR